MNRITIIGNVGRDPELRYTKTQKPFCKFSVASEEVYQYQGEERTKTTWFNCTIWGENALMARNHMSKGVRIAVFGRLEIRNDKESGKTFVDVKVDSWMRADSNDLKDRNQDGTTRKAQAPAGEEADDDIPF